jgi:RNA polymerase sigma-70 factor (ECF subfamily)
MDAASWLDSRWPWFLTVAASTGLPYPLYEDAAQDAQIKVWRFWNTYQPTLGTRESWAASITRRTAIDLHRKRERRPSERLTPTVAMGDAEDEGLNRARVWEAWDRLTSRERRYVRSLLEGYTCAECARLLGVPEGTFKTAMRRLRLRLTA